MTDVNLAIGSHGQSGIDVAYARLGSQFWILILNVPSTSPEHGEGGRELRIEN